MKRKKTIIFNSERDFADYGILRRLGKSSSESISLINVAKKIKLIKRK